MDKHILIKQGYSLTKEVTKMNVDIIHQFLSEQSYWAKGIPRNIVENSINHSLCYAILFKNELTAFARVITDQATFAILVDVFVLPAHRRKGLSKWLTEEILASPELKNIRRFMLNTDTAQDLYKRYGFKPSAHPETFMEIHKPNMYLTINDKDNNSGNSPQNNNNMRAKL